jgi:hypothetical protein
MWERIVCVLRFAAEGVIEKPSPLLFRHRKRICLGYLNILTGTVKPLNPHCKNIAKNDLKSPKHRVPRARKKVREVF